MYTAGAAAGAAAAAAAGGAASVWTRKNIHLYLSFTYIVALYALTFALAQEHASPRGDEGIQQ